jgi:hypothetical protein
VSEKSPFPPSDLDLNDGTQRVMVLAIMGRHKLYVTLTDFLAITGYWTGDSHGCDSAADHEYNMCAGSWVSIVAVEDLYFRQGDFTRYDLRHWNVPSRLPLGGAALGASFLALSFVIPSINQAWYAGPIAQKAGVRGSRPRICIGDHCGFVHPAAWSREGLEGRMIDTDVGSGPGGRLWLISSEESK